MEMFQQGTAPIRASQEQLERKREPSAAKKARFTRAILEREDAFIDPLQEAQLLLPEQSAASSAVMFDSALSTMRTMPTERKTGAFISLYEYLLSIFTSVRRRLKGSSRYKARLTLRGEEALSQLRYLSLLCDATECRTPEEVLVAEGAFGEAYHEIMSLSANLEKMAEREKDHHLHHYKRHFSSILRSTD